MFFFINFPIYKTLTETIEVDLVNLSNVEALSSNASKSSVVATGPIINLDATGNNSGRSVSPNLSNLSHLSQPVKKESNLRSWFHLPTAFNASAATGRSTPAPLDVKSTSIYSADTPSVAITNDDTNDDTNSPPQSMKTSKSSTKTNFGESFYNKQNKLKEQKFTSPGSPAPSTSSTPSSNVVVVVAPTTSNANSNVNVNQTNITEQQQQTKSSRRTTSLLNLFMSNSQGNSSHITFF